jgi:hypothetical protein
VKLSIEKAYPQIIQNSCLEILTDLEFSIYDSEIGRCFIQKKDDEITHFTVKNPNQKEISFLAIDKCVFMDSDKIKRCDCAVFDNKTFCFIEIKETNNRKSENSRKAKEQLLTTIKEFKDKIDFSDKRLEAYVVVGLDFKKVSPASKSQDLLSTLKFERLGVTLFHDGNEKKFK